MDRFDPIGRLDVQFVTDGLAHQLAVPSGVLLSEEHIDVVAVGFPALEPVEFLVALFARVLWSRKHVERFLEVIAPEIRPETLLVEVEFAFPASDPLVEVVIAHRLKVELEIVSAVYKIMKT